MPIANINWNGQTYRINFDRKLTDTEVFDYMQKNFPKQQTTTTQQEEEKVVEQPTQKKSIKDFYNEQLSPVAKKLGEKVLGTSRALTQGASIGQAPQLAGVTNELANLPKKFYGAKTIDDLIKLYKDTGKDYVKGREQFKAEYKNFEDKNKGLALGSELVGGLATGGGLLKGLSLTGQPLLSTILKGGAEGGLLGSLYGGSNVEGKAFDPKSAALGGAIGLGAGALLPLGIEGIKGLGTLAKLYGKGVDKVADKTRVFKPITEEVTNPVTKENIVDSIIEAENKGAMVDKAFTEKNPLEKVVEESTETISTKQNPIKTKKAVEGDVISYIKPNGMQNKVIKYVRDNEAVRDEILKRQGDFGMRFGKYGDDAIKTIKEIAPTIKNAENKAYQEAFEKVGIKNGDEYFVNATPKIVDDLNNAIYKYEQEIADKELAQVLGYDVNLGNTYKNIMNRKLINNGGITFGELKGLTKKLNYHMKQLARNEAKGKGSPEYQLLKDMSAALSELKHQDKVLGFPTQKFAKLEDAIERLEEEGGFKLDDKGAKQNAAKIFQNIRDRAGDTQETALDDFVDAISEFGDTKELANVKNKIQMAQASYGARDTVRDSKLSADIMKYSQNPKNLTNYFTSKLWNGQDLNNDEFLLMVANGLRSGRIKPKDLTTFGRVRVPNMSDYEANRLYLMSKLFGLKTGGLKGIVFQTLGGK